MTVINYNIISIIIDLIFWSEYEPMTYIFFTIKKFITNSSPIFQKWRCNHYNRSNESKVENVFSYPPTTAFDKIVISVNKDSHIPSRWSTYLEEFLKHNCHNASHIKLDIYYNILTCSVNYSILKLRAICFRKTLPQ